MPLLAAIALIVYTVYICREFLKGTKSGKIDTSCDAFFPVPGLLNGIAMAFILNIPTAAMFFISFRPLQTWHIGLTHLTFTMVAIGFPTSFWAAVRHPGKCFYCGERLNQKFQCDSGLHNEDEFPGERL